MTVTGPLPLRLALQFLNRHTLSTATIPRKPKKGITKAV